MVERKWHPHYFFSQEEKEEILEAIRTAEKNTSGEILFYLDQKGKGHVLERAKKVFYHHHLHQRKHRNAVLIYVSLLDRNFAILGDEEIHQQVGQAFWESISQSMKQYFSNGEYCQGLEDAIQKIGQKFHEYFYIKNNI